MSRLALVAIVLGSVTAYAQPAPQEPAPDTRDDPQPPEEPPPKETPSTPVLAPSTPAPPMTATTAAPTTTVAPEDASDQSISAEIGIAAGGRVTPGGLQLGGHYLYQLSDIDWFDGSIRFTYGSGAAKCFRDRTNAEICDHGLADGAGFELGATVRRFVGGKDQFWPFVRAGVGIGLARFSDDGVTGVTIPFHAGAGVRVSVTPDVAIVGQALLDVGFGAFNHGLGLEPIFGLVVAASAEFRL